MGVKVSRATRTAVYERDDWTCHICRLPTRTDRGTGDPWAPSLDHLTPRIRGGGNTVEEMRTAHNWCNTIRGTEPLGDEVPVWAVGGPPESWKQSRAVVAERMTGAAA